MSEEKRDHAIRLFVLIINVIDKTHRIDVACIILLSHIAALGAAGAVQEIEIHAAAMQILQPIISMLNGICNDNVDHTPLRSSKHFQRGVRD